MEPTATGIRAQGESFLLQLLTQDLKPSATTIIERAVATNRITIGEITSMVPNDVIKNRTKLASVIANIIGILRQANIITIFETPTSEKKIDEKIQQPIHFPSQKTINEHAEEDDVEEVEDFGREASGASFYARIIKPYSPLTEEQLVDLSERSLGQKDIDARNRIVLHNLKLVDYLIRHSRYWQMYTPTFDHMDCIQEGNLGLIKAAEKYDYKLGRLPNYARFYIARYIIRYFCYSGGIVSIPDYLGARFFGFRFKTEDNKDSPEIDGELPEFETPEQKGLSPKNLRLIKYGFFTPNHIDSLLEEEDVGRRYPELLANDRYSPDYLLEAKEELEEVCLKIKSLIQTVATMEIRFKKILKPAHFRMFMMRYGLDTGAFLDTDFRPMTLQEIADASGGITRERVRQIIRDIWLRLEKRNLFSSLKKEKGFVNFLGRLIQLESITGIEINKQEFAIQQLGS